MNIEKVCFSGLFVGVANEKLFVIPLERTGKNPRHDVQYLLPTDVPSFSRPGDFGHEYFANIYLRKSQTPVSQYASLRIFNLKNQHPSQLSFSQVYTR